MMGGYVVQYPARPDRRVLLPVPIARLGGAEGDGDLSLRIVYTKVEVIAQAGRLLMPGLEISMRLVTMQSLTQHILSVVVEGLERLTVSLATQRGPASAQADSQGCAAP